MRAAILQAVDFCAGTVPRPRHLLRLRRTMFVVAVAVGLLTVAAAFAPSVLAVVDEPLSEWLRARGSTDWWKHLSEYGSSHVYVPVAVVAAILLWHRCRSLAVAWPVLIATGSALNVVLKVLVDRPRPDDPLAGVALASYPSGHAIHATLFLGLLPPTVYLLTRRSWTVWVTGPVAALMVVGVGASRVALGAHWPTDIVTGVLIGVALLVAADLTVELAEERRMPQLANLKPSRWRG
jgi:undecaprenyl-diphosphatase